MQRKTKPDSSDPSITLTGLSVTNEPALVNLAIGLYAVAHPLEKAHAGLSRSIGVTEGTLIQAAAGNTHIGLDAWRAIEETLSLPLMHIYIEGKKAKP